MSTSNFQWRHDGLGCINDYVENQHFNTIIVANEKAIREQEANKLESDKIAIGYAEIKEKVVERQLAFQSEVPVKQDELRSNPTSWLTKTNIVLIEHCFSTSGKPPKSIKYNCTIKIYSIHQKINHFLREE